MERRSAPDADTRRWTFDLPSRWPPEFGVADGGVDLPAWAYDLTAYARQLLAREGAARVSAARAEFSVPRDFLVTTEAALARVRPALDLYGADGLRDLHDFAGPAAFVGLDAVTPR